MTREYHPVMQYVDKQDQRVEALAFAAATVLFGPMLIAKSSPGYVWLAVILVALAGIGATLVFLARKLSVQQNFWLVLLPALLLLFSANLLSGGPQSRFSILYYVLVLFATSIGGLRYGAGAILLAGPLVVLPLAVERVLSLRAVEDVYLHAAGLATAFGVGVYLGRRRRLSVQRLEAVNRIALRLHRHEQVPAVLRSLVAAAIEVTGSRGAVLYQSGRDGPTVLASRGRWSQDLYEMLAQPDKIAEFRLPAANDVYHLALREPRYRDERMWEGVRIHLQLALRRVQRLAAASAELERWQGRSVSTRLATVEALMSALERRDAYTAAHSRRVASYAAHLARRLGQGEEMADLVRLGGLVHDIGKIALPDTILLKPGPLTSEEWLEVRKHPETGVEILGASPELDPLVPAVRWHHERWDGLGYPDGLSAERIPLAARIVAVADAFDAMTTSRTYKRPSSSGQACAILREGAGSQWCPICAGAMADMIDGRRSLKERLLT